MTCHVVMFPGQGVQRRGMGADLFDRFPETVAAAAEVLGYSIRDLCLENDGGRLSLTTFAQPAVYVVNALALQAHRETAPSPHVAIGHSLGEYNALHAAGVFDFAEGLKLVKARARATACVSGAMLAVVGLSRQQVDDVLNTTGRTEVHIANFNSARQLVLSGPAGEIDAVHPALELAGARLTQRLRVNGPFHSPHMAPAAEQFEPAVQAASLEAPAIPVVANLTARPHRASSMRSALVQHLTSPVLWKQSMEWLWQEYEGPKRSAAEQDGRSREALHITELGSGKVLMRLMRHLRSEYMTGTT
ncbi:hypothetical protein Slala05_82920 [Streptomyces lavendulae subsp. lavendulae]|nr:hypothetical protein Slala05_82920 [Streptomyces lavendulae subsp. lavendulae]